VSWPNLPQPHQPAWVGRSSPSFQTTAGWPAARAKDGGESTHRLSLEVCRLCASMACSDDGWWVVKVELRLEKIVRFFQRRVSGRPRLRLERNKKIARWLHGFVTTLIAPGSGPPSQVTEEAVTLVGSAVVRGEPRTVLAEALLRFEPPPPERDPSSQPVASRQVFFYQ